jgi:hypothetical protein
MSGMGRRAACDSRFKQAWHVARAVLPMRHGTPHLHHYLLHYLLICISGPVSVVSIFVTSC